MRHIQPAEGAAPAIAETASPQAEALDHRYLPLVLDVLDQGVFTVDGKARITSFNRAAEWVTGFKAAEVIGKRCSEVFRTNLCEQVCPLRHSIASREPLRDREVHIRTRDGRMIPISVSTAPLVTRGGRLLGGVEVFRDLTQVADLKRRLGDRHRLEEIVGKSPAMMRIFELLPLVAQSDATALISGESGTGKELIARTIHALGPRQERPFVPVNCAAIPETLIESELFGYKRGAFTDARKDKPGRIAAAERGTLFLDEVGDLPKLTQVKVLRFLQDRSYEPLGTNQAVKADVRVVAATNRNLLEMIREGDLRQDLYFRLNVVQIDIPPLRERTEDIPLLVNHYVRLFRQSTRRPIEGLTEAAMAAVLAYDFPGNVRELENIIERAFVLCQQSHIGMEHLPATLLGARNGAQVPIAAPASVAAAEETAIYRALDLCHGNRTRAAALLGIHRTTLVRKLRKLGRRA